MEDTPRSSQQISVPSEDLLEASAPQQDPVSVAPVTSASLPVRTEPIREIQDQPSAPLDSASVLLQIVGRLDQLDTHQRQTSTQLRSIRQRLDHESALALASTRPAEGLAFHSENSALPSASAWLYGPSGISTLPGTSAGLSVSGLQSLPPTCGGITSGNFPALSVSQPSPAAVPSFGHSAPQVSTFKIPATEKFTGTDEDQDLESWSVQVMRYIRLSNVAEHQKVDVAASCLSGPAAKAWSAIEYTKHQHGEVISLDAFFDTLRTSYGQIFPEQQIRQEIRNLKQNASVEQYARTFRIKIGQLKNNPMAQADQVNYFLQGLKESIRLACLWDPSIGGPFQSLQSLAEYAVAYDISQNRDQQYSKDFESNRTEQSPSSRLDQWQNAGQKRKQSDESWPARDPAMFTPRYEHGSREWLYINQNRLCFHCMSDQHSIRECPVKNASPPGRPTRPNIPSDWQPDKSK